VMSFYRAAVKNKRKLVIDTRFAYILDQLQDKVDLPDPRTDPHLRVYYRLAKSRKDGSVGFDKMSYSPWEREYMDNMVTYEDLSKKGSDYVMHIGFYKLMELVYIQPKNGAFIYSQSEHFLEGEDNEDEKRVLENWLRHFGIHTIHKAHCSGHASKKDLFEVIKTVNPKILIPVHTGEAHVREFSKAHPNVLFPQKGKSIEL
ncbi:MAG: hypothetical protein KGH63_02555, partial [Candidatus Micrarchaeota archaeon]|nr:hypothetical protein [Candidatus Micrarchaeota archaeon]